MNLVVVMYYIKDLAIWFLNKEDMAHKKLQKLCYYAVAWHYTLYNSKIITDDTFEAWIHGPVSKQLWVQYNYSGWEELSKDGPAPEFNDESNEFLEIIYNTYGDLSGHQLETLTHEEQPWIEARGGLSECEASTTPINVETMKEYYRSSYDSNQND